MADPSATAEGSGDGGRHDARRPRLRVILLVVALVLGISGVGMLWAGVTWQPGQAAVAAAGEIPRADVPISAPPSTSVPTTEAAAPVVPQVPADPLSRSLPVSVKVPRIGVDSTLLSLGLNPDRTVEVPKDFSKAGWYDYGPTPGEQGASVILGHIDSFRGPAVFYKLSQLVPGDLVQVTRRDGTTANFTVDARRQYPKKQFPAKDVYGKVDYAGLRLVTCGGQFDSKARSYLDNIVVYAHLSKPA
ncbi:class F sortase [Amycolatopsis sp. H20-H5]|uniref:class F sortase n=1 Tax=Amycolatopsis sp. H20-H5 TaxID=3046309 RepID=UPI002DBACBC3|nr:class F sortase [Amycolatopsis sp. H20-H5]MEC3980382.1 class F sortase [Amycolatopsis sp. H20-H5]